MAINSDNILVHIGYHKTGTTWLQQELFVHGNPVFEPLSSRDHSQSTLARLFIYDNNGYLLSPFIFDAESVSAACETLLQKEGRDYSSKIPVISHERLVGNPNTGGFDAAAIATRIKSVIPNASIFIVIRNQEDMLLSDYYNYLYLGGSMSLKKYLAQKYDGKVPGFSPGHFEYLPLIEAYIRLFGKDKVLVLPYEIFLTKPEKYFESIGAFIGRKVLVEKEKFQKKRNVKTNRYVNYRLRWMSFLIMSNSMNAYSPFYTKVGNLLCRGIKEVLQRILPGSLEKKLIRNQKKLITAYTGDRYIESNTLLSGLIGIDLAAYGYKIL